jgi:tRNA A37 threonylcarbamoyladenosine modification protein TsaB
VALAKALHLANNAKIVTVDTLDTIIMNLPIDSFNEKQTVATILDAKRNQFYIAVYQCGVMQKNNTPLLAYKEYHKVWNKIVDDTIMTPEQLLETLRSFHHPVYLLGDGLLYYQEAFKTEWTHIVDANLWSPRACNVYTLGHRKALLGQFTDPRTLTPRYLSPPHVTIQKDRP